MKNKYILFITSITFVLVLLVFLAPQFDPEIKISEKEKVLNTIGIIGEVIEHIKKDLGHYPNSNSGLEIIYRNINNNDNWAGPYLKRRIDTTDPWGNHLVYLYPNTCNSDSRGIALYSVGENGIDECMKGDDVFMTK